ncbi:hypothetical protein KO481_05315 [Nocardia sp. NEAU-G5]|uniref:PPE family domain-containing protein n=1 Tax=Nocardia albiluteola TaxID=2842303 RepID=A0ABS6ASE4_9NOCA|nr:hypothetical protein [Nocardia albiluteola]MBU3060942.1 hypothetical protein [Nocardia albiluteola]
MSYDDYKRKVIAAQEQWNKDRDWIYKTEGQGNYGTEFSGDVQNPAITTPDSYDHMDLAAMQQSVNAMNPKQVDQAVTAWANIGATLTGTFSQFQQQFAKTINGDNGHSGWRGQAATAAVQAVNNYTDKSNHLAHAATAVSLKLSEMKTGLEETQSLMPGVTTPTPSGKTLPTDGVMKVDDHNKQEATQEARRILTTVYGPVASQTDTGVPYLPTAPQLTSDPNGPVGPSGPNSKPVTPAGGTGPTNTGASGPSAGGATGPANSGATGPDSSKSPGATGPGESATGPSSTSSNPADSTSTAGVKSQSYSPTTQSSTPSMATSVSSPTTPGTTSSPNYSSYTPGSNLGGSTNSGIQTPTTNAPGRSVPGSTGTAQPAAVSTTSAAAAARAGTTGMTGMNPAAAKGKGEDSEKSGTPDYLVTKEHGDELTGLGDQPKMVPPVLGGDYDAPKY